jgi:hypothetical protein
MTPAAADPAAGSFPLRCHPARADGSKTGRSPAAQRRPQGVLDAAAREPIMPAAGKERRSRP